MFLQNHLRFESEHLRQTNGEATASRPRSSFHKRALNLNLKPGNGTVPSDSTTDSSTTVPSTNNMTSPVATTTNPDQSPVGTIIAIVITIVCVAALVIAIIYMVRRMGFLDGVFGPRLKRRSSTSSSQHPLDVNGPHDQHDDAPDPDRPQDREDMFTIDDMGEDEEEREDREGYFYDEVFSPSQFQDERTVNSVRQLVSEGGNSSESQPDNDELLDFDFETLGIKIDGYGPESSTTLHRTA